MIGDIGVVFFSISHLIQCVSLSLFVKFSSNF